MASESIAHEAEGRMGYWLRAHSIRARGIIVNQLHALVQESACFLKDVGGVDVIDAQKSIFLYSF